MAVSDGMRDLDVRRGHPEALREPAGKRPYRPPGLVQYGSIEELTGTGNVAPGDGATFGSSPEQ